MRNATSLIDSGPLIALFDSRDHFHNSVVEALKSFKGHLVTTWPVITETLHLLSFSVQAQLNFLEWVDRGALQIADLGIQDIKYIKERMGKYANVPMDLADASLMCVAEKSKIHYIFSVDSDFSIYRTLAGKFLKNLLLHK